MPLYTLMIPAGALSGQAKRGLAVELTDLHCALSGVPRSWVHVVFQEYEVANGFTAGAPAPVVALTLAIRTGRSAEYKRDFLKRIWALVQKATGAPDDQIVIGIQEVPASQAMEMGAIMPDVSGAMA
jgi:phenylpyruvate tautomerase PptA (4-oxalocrotonate tautomerase family)